MLTPAEIGLKALPYVAVLVVGAGIGWALKPDVVRVEEKLHTVEVEKQVVVEKEVVRVEVVKVKDTQVVERWHREKTEEKRPDGTVVTKETEDRNVDSVVKEKENSTQVQIVEVEKQVVVQVDRIVEKRIEPVLAQWRAGVDIGTGLELKPLGLGGVVLGVGAERRVGGPFWLGAWGQTTTDLSRVVAGGKLSLEF